YQADTLGCRKADLSIAWLRLLTNGWSTQLSVEFGQNSELGLKERWVVNLMGLKDISYNNRNRFYAGIVLALTHEIPYGNPSEQNDIACIFQLVCKVYKYKNPKLWVDSDISFLPYLTESNRNRVVFNLNPKISIFSDDFKVGLKFYY